MDVRWRITAHDRVKNVRGQIIEHKTVKTIVAAAQISFKTTANPTDPRTFFIFPRTDTSTKPTPDTIHSNTMAQAKDFSSPGSPKSNRKPAMKIGGSRKGPHKGRSAWIQAVQQRKEQEQVVQQHKVFEGMQGKQRGSPKMVAKGQPVPRVMKQNKNINANINQPRTGPTRHKRSVTDKQNFKGFHK